MHAVLLAGGFARRLWPLTKDKPKPLLPVGGRPIIEHILERLSSVDEIEKIHISVNSRFEPHFNEWLGKFSSQKPIEIFTEPSTSEENKLGAVGALGYLFREKGIDGDVLVVAGDNLFDFDINHFLAQHNGDPSIALYEMADIETVRNKYGVVELDGNSIIRNFQEKPDQPASSFISTGCYFFPKRAVNLLHEYLSGGNNPDAPGFFVSWLSRQVPVRGHVFNSDTTWFDIGSIESYREADRIMSERQRNF